MLTRQQISTIQLSTLGLLQSPPKNPSKSDVIKTINQIGMLQIDTISVVNRSPYLVLWSRLGNFDPAWLEQTHQDGELFEYWAHAASFLPIHDYPLFRRLMLERATHWWNVNEWVENHQEIIQFVLESIREKGPLKSSDFPRQSGKANGWWDWKDEKIALDMLWTKGELSIPYRKNFQRFYDLSENVIDRNLLTDVPDLATTNKLLVEKAIRSLGGTRQKWIADYYRRKQVDVAKSVKSLLEDKKIILFPSEDFEEGILVHRDNLDLIDLVLKGDLTANHTTFLSPFDPLIWDRTRTKELFNFDYSLECYLPATKRKYGYFSLPILYYGSLVGRIDAKAHRKEGIMEIKNLHFESGFKINNKFLKTFVSTIRQFAEWHKSEQIKLPLDLEGKIKKLVDFI